MSNINHEKMARGMTILIPLCGLIFIFYSFFTHPKQECNLLTVNEIISVSGRNVTVLFDNGTEKTIHHPLNDIKKGYQYKNCENINN